jgi:hypothetical protein
MKSHTKDKVFDEMWYCELPSKEIMLEVEAYYISQKNPQLNKTKPSYTITETPEYIKWIQANLDFLRTDDVDFDHYLAQCAYWEYYLSAMEDLGIPEVLFNTGIHLKFINNQIVAVFDGSGDELIEFLKLQGYCCLEDYTESYTRSNGKISLASYEKSLKQFS